LYSAGTTSLKQLNPFARQLARRSKHVNLEVRVKQAIQRNRSPVILRSELRGLGSSSQLSVALRALLDQGVLVRIGVGIYAKAKLSVLSGKPIPISPLEVLAPLALQKLGVKVQASRGVREYNSGATTQVPAGLVVNVGQRRITRTIGFNGKVLEYERN
jgi:hypothetical protein